MLHDYLRTLLKYLKLSLPEERRLIAKAKKGSQKAHHNIYNVYVVFFWFGWRLVSYDKFAILGLVKLIAGCLVELLKKYSLSEFYSDFLRRTTMIIIGIILMIPYNEGNFKPVRFSSYVWKRIEGFILDSLKKEISRESRQTSPDWERYELEEVI